MFNCAVASKLSKIFWLYSSPCLERQVNDFQFVMPPI